MLGIHDKYNIIPFFFNELYHKCTIKAFKIVVGSQRSTSNYHVEGREGAGFRHGLREKVTYERDILKNEPSKGTWQTQRDTPADNIMNQIADNNFSLSCS